jgi:RNA polymerase sigma-70 factor, ECF subfamily
MTADQKQEQFIKSYNDHIDAIFRYILFRVYERQRAHELTQEVFTKVWKVLVDGKDIENFRAFLYKVAYHQVVDESRKKKEHSLESLMETGFQVSGSGEKELQDMSDVGILIEKIESMGEKYRDILLMRYVDDLPVGDIATALELSENVVSVRIHRGIKQLRNSF